MAMDARRNSTAPHDLPPVTEKQALKRSRNICETGVDHVAINGDVGGAASRKPIVLDSNETV